MASEAPPSEGRVEGNAPHPPLEGQGEGREAYSINFRGCSRMVRFFPNIHSTVPYLSISIYLSISHIYTADILKNEPFGSIDGSLQSKLPSPHPALLGEGGGHCLLPFPPRAAFPMP